MKNFKEILLNEVAERKRLEQVEGRKMLVEAGIISILRQYIDQEKKAFKKGKK